jgi:hypothetical protein
MSEFLRHELAEADTFSWPMRLGAEDIGAQQGVAHKDSLFEAWFCGIIFCGVSKCVLRSFLSWRDCTHPRQ